MVKSSAPDFSTDELGLDGYVHLLVAVCRLAIRDAQGGDPEAAQWLNELISDWQARIMTDMPRSLVKWGMRKGVAQQHGLGKVR